MMKARICIHDHTGKTPIIRDVDPRLTETLPIERDTDMLIQATGLSLLNFYHMIYLTKLKFY